MLFSYFLHNLSLKFNFLFHPFFNMLAENRNMVVLWENYLFEF